MANWLAPALLAFIIWGFWAFLPKIATQYIDPKSIIFYEVFGTIIIGLIALVSLDFKVQTDPRGVALAVIVGALGLGGSFAYVYAIAKGPVGIISIFTALYPILTILLAYFILHEPISVKQGIGICFAMVAIFLLST
ncbi:EamA family transporter [Kaarinaea lacus]